MLEYDSMQNEVKIIPEFFLCNFINDNREL